MHDRPNIHALALADSRSLNGPRRDIIGWWSAIRTCSSRDLIDRVLILPDAIAAYDFLSFTVRRRAAAHHIPTERRADRKRLTFTCMANVGHFPPPWKPFLLKLPSRIYRAICTACLVVWRPRRAADTSTNRRHGFRCCRTASMEQAADTSEAAAVDRYFSSSTENVAVSVCLWTPGYRLMIVL